ncbi:MAG: hypothetical protein M1269_10830 [Chloroflexi bacterium]|nr:hypothetical protein [Chloroflexota bacterium]
MKTALIISEEIKNSQGESLEKMRDFLDSLFLSYEVRVKTVGDLMMRTFTILQDFHLRQEENIARLQASLAKQVNLRKKDFDSIMSEIIDFRRKREEVVETSIVAYIREEGEMIDSLKKKISRGMNLREFKDLKEEINSRQKERENGVVKVLRDFQREEEELNFALDRLLNKKELKIKDFKVTVKLLELQNSERNMYIKEVFVDALEYIRERTNQDWNGLKLTLE